MCRHQKIAIMGIYGYRKYMGLLREALFSKKKKNSIFSSPDCFIRIKQPEKLVLIFFQPFSKSMKIVWQKVVMNGIVWYAFSVNGGQPGEV